MYELLPLDRAFSLSYRGIESAQLFKQKENISSRSKNPRRCSKSHQNIVISGWRFFFKFLMDALTITPLPRYTIPHTTSYTMQHASCTIHHTPVYLQGSKCLKKFRTHLSFLSIHLVRGEIVKMFIVSGNIGYKNKNCSWDSISLAIALLLYHIQSIYTRGTGISLANQISTKSSQEYFWVLI